MDGEFSLQTLYIKTTEAINSVIREDWEGYCRHVQNLRKSSAKGTES